MPLNFAGARGQQGHISIEPARISQDVPDVTQLTARMRRHHVRHRAHATTRAC